MEKATNVLLVRGDFIWDDLGSWEQIYNLTQKDKDGNAVTGDALVLDTSNSYVYSSHGVVAVVGLDNIIVVQEGGSTLVCSRDKVEEVRKIVEKLKRGKFKKYA
jgi:mannose-1-phosphate guanylyltransferase